MTDISRIQNKADAMMELTLSMSHDNEFIADVNRLYKKNGLYYECISPSEWKHQFATQWLSQRNDYRPNFADDSYRSMCQMNYTDQPIDQQPNLIPFQNGIYNLTTYEFMENTDGVYITTHFPFDYEPAPQCPLFEQAISEIIPDESMQTYFLTFMNYAFTSNIDLQVALILVGSGNNGKSTLMEFFMQIMGNRATAIKIGRLNDDNYRCNLKGKTLCYSSEIGGHFLNQSEMDNIKELITERFKTGRKAYEQLESWNNITKFIMATNRLPNLQSEEQAFYRRFKFIPFPTDFSGREDRTLFERIYNQEAGHILSWILQNYRDWSTLTTDWHETQVFWHDPMLTSKSQAVY